MGFDPGSLATLTGLRDYIARGAGAADYASLGDAAEQTLHDIAVQFALLRVQRETGWQWDRRYAEFATEPTYATGTLTLTAGSAAVVGAGSPAFTTNWRRHDAISVSSALLRVASVTDATNAVLFGGSPVAGAGLTYTRYRDEYFLDDGVMYLDQVLLTYPSQRPLTLVSSHDWLARTGGGRVESGEPTLAMVMGADTTESGATGVQQRLRLWPFPSSTRVGIGYHFRRLPFFPASGADKFEMGFTLMDLVSSAALKQIFLRLGEAKVAEQHEAQYQLLLPGARAAQSSKHRPHVRLGAQWDIGGGSPEWPGNWRTPIVVP